MANSLKCPKCGAGSGGLDQARISRILGSDMVCRHCGYRFPPTKTLPAPGETQKEERTKE